MPYRTPADARTWKGAELIVEQLVREHVPYTIGMCGHGNLGLLDALHDRRDEIKTMTVHHESAAGFIADAYFRVSGQPLATFTSCGPGSANLPVALGSALMDSSALLAITGNVPTNQFNRGPFQETGRHYQADFPTAIRPYVKRSFQATRPDQLALMLRQAFSTMLSGRPGPVHLDVPLNVFVEEAQAVAPDPGLWHEGVSPRVAAGEHELQQSLALLLRAHRPVIVVGHGVEISDASQALLRLAELCQIPVATSPLGKGTFPAEHPLHLGPTGRNGSFTANQATRGADVVLAVGTRFDDRSTSSWLPGMTYSFPPSKLIHVDLDVNEIGRNFPPTLGIIADARTVFDQLHGTVVSGRTPVSPDRNAEERSAWLQRIAGWRSEWDAHLSAGARPDVEPIDPQRLLTDLRHVLPDDGILVSDVGAHHNWIVQRWPTRAPRTLLQSWGFASMGFGVAGALGAQLAAPSKPVVAVVGDGGFLLMPSAVATAVQYDLPVVWIVWNNGGYVSIRDQQRGYFGANRELATSFVHDRDGTPYSADFGAMARAMGANGVTVERPADLAQQIDAALASRRPTVLDVRVDSEAVLPTAASWDLPPLSAPTPSFTGGSGQLAGAAP
jgi:acetolactate synthase-1/2/3 large subunit